ncbi:hypothetical protein JR316_0010138 [Psilocybe cubensis]|uniref:Uncharacterized protein n=1 Tax=Psilocybe cubensis TaxID=181762 RepID=A0ACB8GQG8_PSICU|nr:hypothetical protein JR316_0010138 [Psilocybe cubensis]KAH9477906.1 hypothetical protein JR316_0010138 [Psilocybe cubensis]
MLTDTQELLSILERVATAGELKNHPAEKHLAIGQIILHQPEVDWDQILDNNMSNLESFKALASAQPGDASGQPVAIFAFHIAIAKFMETNYDYLLALDQPCPDSNILSLDFAITMKIFCKQPLHNYSNPTVPSNIWIKSLVFQPLSPKKQAQQELKQKQGYNKEEAKEAARRRDKHDTCQRIANEVAKEQYAPLKLWHTRPQKDKAVPMEELVKLVNLTHDLYTKAGVKDHQDLLAKLERQKLETIGISRMKMMLKNLNID